MIVVKNIKIVAVEINYQMNWMNLKETDAFILPIISINFFSFQNNSFCYKTIKKYGYHSFIFWLTSSTALIMVLLFQSYSGGNKKKHWMWNQSDFD